MEGWICGYKDEQMKGYKCVWKWKDEGMERLMAKRVWVERQLYGYKGGWGSGSVDKMGGWSVNERKLVSIHRIKKPN